MAMSCDFFNSAHTLHMSNVHAQKHCLNHVKEKALDQFFYLKFQISNVTSLALLGCLDLGIPNLIALIK